MRRFSCLATLALFAGCTSVQHVPLTPAGAEALRGREVSVASRERPEFTALTPGKAAFGLVGGVLMIQAGNQIVEENKVEDPAAYIARAIGQELSATHGAQLAQAAVRVTTDEVTHVATEQPAADLLLDVRTINWSFSYFPTAWTRYRVIYSARLRLIDVKRARLLAEGFCARDPEQTPQAPTHDELLSNGAERLKRELRSAADFCIQHFRSQTFAFTEHSRSLTARAAVPSVVPAPANLPSVDAPAPAASVAPTPDRLGWTRFPRPGDTWTYRLVKSASAPRTPSTYVVTVAAASDTKIVDRVSHDGATPTEWMHAGGHYHTAQVISVFSPYLTVFEDLRPGTAITDVTENDHACFAVYRCVSQGRVVGREMIQLAAGTFDTIKVTISQLWRGSRGGGAEIGERVMTVWYSPRAKRAVKVSSRMTSGSSSSPFHADFDLELVGYRLQ